MSILKRFQQFNLALQGQFLALGLIVASLLVVPKMALAEFQSIVDIGLNGDFYFVRENANNGQAFANILLENSSGNNRIYIDVGAGGLIGKSGHSYVKAPQFFYQLGSEESMSLYVGRWENKWSFADDYFNLGLTQPLFLWDAARPQKQGLTGVFLDVPELGPFHFTLFGSYVALPTQGATYELVNGDLISSNPWFAAPVEAVSFSGEIFDLNYNIDAPPASEIVFQPSYGAKLSFNDQGLGAFGSGFYLNKPSNDLLLPFEGLLNLSTFQGDVVVRPKLARHQVAGSDLGWRFTRAEVLVSWVYEGGVQFDEDLGTTFPEIPDQNVYVGAINLDLSKRHEIWMSYLSIDRKPTNVLGVYAGNNIDIFSHRNRFEKAARLEWLGRFLQKDGVATFKSKLSYTYDTEDKGSWISGGLQWWVSPGLELMSQCDFFGSPQRELASRGFIGRFQNNDRCIMGGLYAF